MAAQGYVDNFSTTLSSGYTSGGTSLSLSSVTGLPTSGLLFYLKVAADGSGGTDEWFLCTSYSGTTLTVVGAQANTSASNHANGAAVTGCYLTAAALNGIRSDISQIGTYANLPSSGMKKGDVYRCTDSVYEFRFDGTLWQPFIGGNAELVLPPTSSWSWDNQGSSTADSTYGPLYLSLLSANATQIRAYYRTAPSTPYTIKALLRYDLSGILTQSVSSTSEGGLIIGWRDSSGKFVVFTLQLSSSAPLIYLGKWSSSTSFSAAYAGSFSGANTNFFAFGHDQLWVALEDDGTNITVFLSLTGAGTPGSSAHWKQFIQKSRTDFLTAPTNVCVGAYVGNFGSDICVLSWG